MSLGVHICNVLLKPLFVQQVCDRDRDAFISFGAEFIQPKLKTMANLLPGQRKLAEVDRVPNQFSDLLDSLVDLEDEDEHMMTNGHGDEQQRQQLQRSMPSASSDHLQLVFCRFGKNILSHMTLQGEKPEQVDVTAQVFKPEVSNNAQSEEVMVTLADASCVCILNDCAPEDLVNQICVWKLQRSTMRAQICHRAVADMGDEIATSACELLEQMATAKAFSHTPLQCFFYPTMDAAMQVLLEKKLVIGADDAGHYVISAEGASCFSVVQHVGERVPLHDFQQMLGNFQDSNKHVHGLCPQSFSEQSRCSMM